MSGPSHELLKLLLDMEVHGVLTADPQGRVTYGNAAARALLGYNNVEFPPDMHVTDVYYRADDARRVMRAARAEGGSAVDALLRTRSGDLVPSRVHVRMHTSAEGTFLGTIGLLIDQRELLDLDRRLEEAASQVIAAERRAAAMEGGAEAANDLRQPMMAAMGNIELAMMEPHLDARVASRLARAYEQLERLRVLTAHFATLGAGPSIS